MPHRRGVAFDGRRPGTEIGPRQLDLDLLRIDRSGFVL
jgi:7,8-dihydro-6-hydroxymethylpterin-pyrophosphokinase